MIYVDLNPFRAGIVDTPEDSKYTSLRKRLLALKHNLQPPNLLHFTSRSAKTDTAAIPLPLNHYLQLVDESARISKNYNQQKISPDCCDILTRLGLQADQWQISINNLESLFPVAIGNIESMDKYKVSTGRIRLRGAQNALKLYRSLGLKTH